MCVLCTIYFFIIWCTCHARNCGVSYCSVKNMMMVIMMSSLNIELRRSDTKNSFICFGSEEKDSGYVKYCQTLWFLIAVCVFHSAPHWAPSYAAWCDQEPLSQSIPHWSTMLAVHASSLDRVERASTAVHQHEMQLFRTGKASFSLVKKWQILTNFICWTRHFRRS